MKAGYPEFPLESLCDYFGDGDWVESKDQAISGIRLIQTGNVGEGAFKDRGDKARYIDEPTFKRLRCTEIHPGDCLVSRLPDPVGRACLVPDTGERMITAVDCTIVRPNVERLEPQYLVHFSRSEKYLREVEIRCTGATRLRISRSGLGKVPIPLPHLEEQRRIVAILDEAFEGLDRARANAEANLASARELFDELVNTCFRQAADKAVVETTLGTIAEFRNGLNYSRSSKGRSVKIVGVGDFKDNLTVPEDSLSRTTIDGTLAEDDKLRTGDLIAVRSNGNRELIGRTMMVSALSEDISFSGFTIRIRLKTERLLPEYLCEFMRTKAVHKMLIDGGGGSNISNLNQRLLSGLPVRYPSTVSQHQVLEDLQKLRGAAAELATEYRSKLQSIADLRQSLLQKAFAGELT